MHFVYILVSLKDRNFYVGSSRDIFIRFKQHNDGTVTSTRHRRPFVLMCYEAYLTKVEALRREKYLKTSDGRKELRIRLATSIDKIGIHGGGIA